MTFLRPVYLIFIMLSSVAFFTLPTQASAEDEDARNLHYVSTIGGPGRTIQYGDAVYLIQGRTIRTLDVSNPQKITERHVLDLGGQVEKYILKPPALYLAIQQFGEYRVGFLLVDLTNPWEPRRRSDDVKVRWQKYDLEISLNEFLNVQGRDYDITDPLHPTPIREDDDADGKGKVQKIRKTPKYQIPSIVLEDHIDPVIMDGITPWTNLRSANGLRVNHGRAYVLDDDGLKIINVVDPARPRCVGRCKITNKCTDLAVMDHFVLVTDDAARLNVIDVSDDSSPSLGASINLPSSWGSIAVQGQKAYIAIPPCHSEEGEETPSPSTKLSGLQIIDLATPNHPKEMGFIASKCRDVVVSGTLAYLAAGNLEVIDISDPEKPVRIGVSKPPEKTGIDLSDRSYSLLFYSKEWDKNVVFGVVSDLNLVGHQVIAMGPLVFQEAKNYTFGMINFYDVSNPRQPVWVEAMSDSQFCGVKNNDGLLYAHTRNSSTGNQTNCVELYRLKASASVEKIGTTTEFDEIKAFEVVDDLIYVADGENGLVILKHMK